MQVKKVLLEGFFHGYLLKKRIVGYPLRIEELRQAKSWRNTVSFVSTVLHKRDEQTLDIMWLDQLR